MAPSIPDRWKDYKPVGRKIEGTRFMAFKVPLKEHVSNIADKGIRLDDNILLKKAPKLGLIIDLTNTNRYYDRSVFLKKGIEHRKLMVPGHKIPPTHLINKFTRIVKEFMENNTNNDKLIGVHCTHGVNRTGFFICNYMISHMAIEPNEALKRFANARGHQIERSIYIDALQLLGTNVEKSSAVERTQPDNWRERTNATDSRSRERDQREVRSRNYSNTAYRNNNKSRDRSPHNNNRWRHANFESNFRPFPSTHRYDNNLRNSNYLLPAMPREELAITSYRPSNLRFDYYNTRPINEKQRYTYIRKSHNL